jgi:hypothetical protein
VNWFDTFAEEKGWDLEEFFEVEGPEWGMNLIPLGVVLEAIKSSSKAERDAIKQKLIRLDFADPAAPKKFVRHLAGALAK